MAQEESSVEREVATRLEDLTPGAQVLGIAGSGAVTVVQCQWHGANFVTVTYTDEHGRTDQAVLGRDQQAALVVASRGGGPAFDGDPEAWRLAAEALRIRYAALFDPMLAISTSDLQPLPHQITAVYGELLPRTPLRFLLADDPGAGKTIMAGLYIKELILRGDLGALPDRRAGQPGGAVAGRAAGEVRAAVRDPAHASMIDAEPDGNVFDEHPLLIARMDQLSRIEELQAGSGALATGTSSWSTRRTACPPTTSAPELKTTKRYQLGQLLGRVTRHLLLMTATPHAGKQEDFQLFLALLDGDRFEGRLPRRGPLRRPGRPHAPHGQGGAPHDGGHAAVPGAARLHRPLRALRRGDRTSTRRSPQYVREEMNRADRLKAEGEGRRGNTVGFALTVLQRRLASSPEAIWRSLERRRDRLEKRRQEMLRRDQDPTPLPLRHRLAGLLGRADARDRGRDRRRLDDLAGPRWRSWRKTSSTPRPRPDGRRARDRDRHPRRSGDLARRVRFSGTRPQVERAARRSCGQRGASRRRRPGTPQDHRVHRAPRHPELPGRPDPHAARPPRGGRRHPRRRPPRGAPQGPGAVHAATRTSTSWSRPMPPARA